MRTCGWVVALVFGVAGATALAKPGDAPAGAPADRLERLVARLGSQLFREREAASRELAALGEAALDALRQAARSDDPETRRRATELIERITQRQVAARLLAPTLVALDYKNTPLPDAVADLAERTGAPIALHGDPNRFKGRTVTVATGRLPFWQALEVFCRRADLHEWDGFSPLPPAGSQGARNSDPPRFGPGGVVQLQGAVQMQVQFQGRIVVRGGRISTFVPMTTQPSRVVLLDGPGAALPTHHAGAVRVRGLPPGTPFPAAVGNDLLIPLQVSAEPRLNAPFAADLRLERVLDEQGGPVAAKVVRAAPVVDGEDAVMLINGRVVVQSPANQGGPLGVRLKRGEWTARRLRELAGSVTVQAYVAEPLASLARLPLSVGETALGESGVSVKLVKLDVTRGEVRVTADAQLPFGVEPLRQTAWLPGAQGRAFRGAVLPLDPVPEAAEGTDYQGLSLEDAQGRRLAVVSGGDNVIGQSSDGFTLRIIASFRPGDPVALPARLVFTAKRPATVEVPFVFKDVPLP